MEILIWIILLAPIFVLVGIAQMQDEERRKEWEKEQERLKRVKALYPDPPTYEERMGVQYGSEAATGASGGTGDGT